MGRQVRRVPAGWEHPKRAGRYIPMRTAGDKLARATEERMPAWPAEACTHWQLYEITTAGTPLSPPFASAKELAEWLASHRVEAAPGFTGTAEQWLRMIESGRDTSTVAMKGKSFVSPLDPP
ncbi:hypothetical protein [Bradyrhizobium sp. 174]|uniref:hypothetical protein n=1 Tax=Bradyrhizobium sp. 174 TaxID=2782645 RepID=UPI001FFBB805|nr:hypothetical protein [Bradyrhizobium sp. 174]MCK1577827.1 hypothetical protein [Bradyrhizobium sp. 174]